MNLLKLCALAACLALAASVALAQSPTSATPAPTPTPVDRTAPAATGGNPPIAAGNCAPQSKTVQCCLGTTCRGRYVGGTRGQACKARGGESWHDERGVCHVL